MTRTDAVKRTKPHGVIFDLDGVLIDSEPFWREGFRAAIGHLAERSGRVAPDLPDSVLVRYEGGRGRDTVADLVRDLLPELSENAEQLRAASEVAIETASRLFSQDPRPIADSVRAAREISTQGIRLGVASSSAEPFIRTALQTLGLSDLVFAVHGGFVEVSNDIVTILSDVAELASQIDVTRARAAQQRAEDALRQATDAELEAALRRALIRLEAAGQTAGAH